MVADVRHTRAMEPPTLPDGDLVLRPKRPEDVDAITAACQDPEIPRWTFVPSPYTRADAEAFLARSAEEQAAGKTVHLLAVDADDDRLLGSFSVMELDREPGYGEIGYWVVAEARGRGVATRAVRLLADWARAELGLTRIDILPHKDNAPSRRVAEKAGFRRHRRAGRLAAGGDRGADLRPLRLGDHIDLRRSERARWQYPGSMDVELTYCVVNTEQRQLLSYCLDSIARERATVDFETETLVLDNASHDGSAETARDARRDHRGDRARPPPRRRRERDRPGAARARALLPDPQRGLRARAGRHRRAARGARRPPTARRPRARRSCGPTASSSRPPGASRARGRRLLSLLGLGRRFVVQSHGRRVRDVDWAPVAALLVRREAAAGIEWRDGDEVGFCRRLRQAGWRVLYVPEARAVRHEHR